MQFPLCYTSRVPVGVILFPINAPGMGRFKRFDLWVKLMIMVWVGVRIWDRVIYYYIIVFG